MESSVAAIDPQDELICLGHSEEVLAVDGAMAPPIVQTSLFAQSGLSALHQSLSEEVTRTVYTRGNNPTVAAVEAKLAALERGEACRCFGSGMAAIQAVMQSLLTSGDHLLFVNQVYGPALQLARHLERFDIRHDQVIELAIDAIEAAIRPETRMLWLESPGTMLFRELDLGAVTAVARARGILTVLDNSWASPLLQKPLTHGVDLVVHSATKYIGGHSDVVAGAVVGTTEHLEQIFHRGLLLSGGVLAPFDAWLLNRGLRTLPIRMRAHHSGAGVVARFLAEHPHVRRVFFPGLEPPGAGGAGQAVEGQLSGSSGLLSFEIDSEQASDVSAVVDRLERFRVGVSWGGVESLVLAPYRGDNAESLAAQEIPLGLIRISVGLEPPEVLVADLGAALEALG